VNAACNFCNRSPKPGHSIPGITIHSLIDSLAEVQEFEKIAADKGLYTYRCREGEQDALYASGEVESLFERLVKARLAEWVTLADERLAGTGVRCYTVSGKG
jgi:hypothetical protein